MGRDGAPDDNPRAWARPDRDGDPWHDYWEPEGGTDADPEAVARREMGRRIALVFVTVMPGLMVLDVALRDRAGAPLCAFLAATACVIGLLRVRSYGEDTRWLTLTLAAYIVIWVGLLVAYAAQVEMEAIKRMVE